MVVYVLLAAASAGRCVNQSVTSCSFIYNFTFLNFFILSFEYLYFRNPRSVVVYVFSVAASAGRGGCAQINLGQVAAAVARTFQKVFELVQVLTTLHQPRLDAGTRAQKIQRLKGVERVGVGERCEKKKAGDHW